MTIEIKEFAPICLFVYNKLELTKKTLEYLMKNDFALESDLIIFSDGAKNINDMKSVHDVRNLIKMNEIRNKFKSVSIIEQEKNIGLANSIIIGVTETLKNYNKTIIVEDDLVTSKYFLKYLNEGLTIYETDNSVASIHGWSYSFEEEDIPDTYFLRGADCWGWATWKRAWSVFESDGKKLWATLKQDSDLMKKFDLYFTCNNMKMLEAQIAGKINSWAIRWHASAFLQDMLTLYPGKSLVQNVGVGSHQATHTKNQDELHSKMISLQQEAKVKRMVPVEHLIMRNKIIKILRKEKINKIYKKLLGRIVKLFNLIVEKI